MYSISNFVLGALTIILNMLFILSFKMQAKGLLLANTIANFLVSILVFQKLKLHKYISKNAFSNNTLNKMIKYSFPLVFNNLSWLIISFSDRLMLTSLVGANENGIYSVANRFPNIIYTFYGFFSTAWKESSAKIVKEKNKLQYYNTIYVDMKNFLKAITIGLIAIMPFVFSIFIKSSYNSAYIYIPILSIGIYYTNMSNFYGGIFSAFKNTKIMGYSTVLGAIINIIINFIFMKVFPTYGTLVATLSTLVSTLVVYFYRKLKLKSYIKLYEKYNITYWLLLVMTLVLYYINNKILCAIVLFLVIGYCYITNRKFLLNILKPIVRKIKMKNNALD